MCLRYLLKCCLLSSLLFGYVFAAEIDDRVDAMPACKITVSGENENATEYKCDIQQCTLYVSIDKVGAESYITTGHHLSNACQNLNYDKKTTAWFQLLNTADQNNRFEYVKRVGLGPGSSMCKGKLREKLICVSSRLLSESTSVNDRERFYDGDGRSPKNVVFLWDEANTFFEYKEMFRRLGYPVELSDYEGVVYSDVTHEEIVLCDHESDVELLRIPCNAMVYFQQEQK